MRLIYFTSKIILAFSFILLLPLSASTQIVLTTKDKKAIAYYGEAGQYNKRAMFPEALLSLEKALKRDPNFLEAIIYGGQINEKIYESEKAILAYERAIALAPTHVLVQPLYVVLGREYFKTGKYQLAKETSVALLANANIKPRDRSEAERIVERANFALNAIANPVDFDAQPIVELNAAHPLQYFPAVTVDEKTMIFTARQGLLPNDDEDIYISALDTAGNWLPPLALSPIINSDLNEGACTISADGRTIIYTTCGGRNTLGSCDLYITRKENNGWSAPKNLGSPVNTNYWESQPSLAADGRTLYFVSNRPGGIGKRDIWVTALNDSDQWEIPINLGFNINTEEDDISPFIHFNGENLYFSSQGHLGLGGYDMFKAAYSDGDWREVENLGYPINDLNDQVSLFITAGGTKGYYAHETMEGGKINSSKLYQFELPLSARIKNRSNFLTGIVRNKVTNQPLDAELNLVNINTGEKVSRVKSDKETGKYFVVLTEGQEYGIFINKPGYLFQNLNYNYLEKDTLKPENLDIYLSPISSGAETVLKNIFFKSNEFQLEEKSFVELKNVVQFLTVNPTIRVEISGHTDNTGLAKSNLELSNKRAQSVFDFLVDAGISKARVTYLGFGDKKPIGTNDTEEGKALNRRIAFKIL